MAKRTRLTSIGTKQVLLKLPEGMYGEIMHLIEEKRMWQSIQDFIRDAIMTELRRQEDEHSRDKGPP
ncbi:MAG: ribbon-helix-helix domain-containing protein [Candidatus Thermoplasmatota archaeon]|nr:ribbon-helix-helix domain-containing protein [Candidatus Thermoplasmatota archaeon]